MHSPTYERPRNDRPSHAKLERGLLSEAPDSPVGGQAEGAPLRGSACVRAGLSAKCTTHAQ